MQSYETPRTKGVIMLKDILLPLIMIQLSKYGNFLKVKTTIYRNLLKRESYLKWKGMNLRMNYDSPSSPLGVKKKRSWAIPYSVLVSIFCAFVIRYGYSAFSVKAPIFFLWLWAMIQLRFPKPLLCFLLLWISSDFC